MGSGVERKNKSKRIQVLWLSCDQVITLDCCLRHLPNVGRRKTLVARLNKRIYQDSLLTTIEDVGELDIRVLNSGEKAVEIEN